MKLLVPVAGILIAILAVGCSRQEVDEQSASVPTSSTSASVVVLNESNFDAEVQNGVVLVDFWATWCGPCKIEIPGFIELQDEYGDQGFVVLGLSTDDTADEIKPFADEFAVNYPMLVGLGEDDFQEAWGPIWGLPMSFWIDRDGTWCKTHMGIGTKEEFEADLKSLL